MDFVYSVYLAISRWILPLLTCLLVYLWIRYFRAARPSKQVIGRFVSRGGTVQPFFAQEALIGRAKKCDIVLTSSNAEKRHAIVYQKKDVWYIRSLGGEVWVNDEYAEGETELLDGDMVAFAEQELIFECNQLEEEDIYSYSMPEGGFALFVLTLFQLIMGGQLCLRMWEDLPIMIPICFLVLIVGQWIYFAFSRLMEQPLLLAELPVLYLITLGFAVCSCSDPDSLTKQLFCVVAGVVGCICLTILLRYHELCFSLRYVVALITVAVMGITVVFGTSIYGARNWLRIGSYSFQPSEFAKVALLLVGGCCLYVTLTQWKNRWFFLLFCA
ncbi:MAG: FtsW/RodA/SpoVE family cell cycle protein, partial [Clostridia bacterium]|nr:FtsW/RodA/SpoVE family cell cycle protein [Clostridia bacterium]